MPTSTPTPKPQYLPFTSLWKMRIPIPYSLLIRSQTHLFSSGQCPLSPTGQVHNPNDLFSQVDIVIAYIIKTLEEMKCDVTSICQLVVYHVHPPNSDDVEADLTSTFQEAFGEDIIVVPVRIPCFYYEGMMVEVDVFASISSEKPLVKFHDEASASSLDVVDAGDGLVWASFETTTISKAGIQHVMDRLLVQAGLSVENAMAEVWFMAKSASRSIWDISGIGGEGGDGSGWDVSVVHIDDEEHSGDKLIRCQMTFAHVPPIRCRLFEKDHGIEGVEIKFTITTKFFSVEGISTIAKDGLVGQTEKIMRGIDWTLKTNRLSFDHVFKSTTYYTTGGSEEDLHANMNVRNQYYKTPGPASTGLPVYSFLNDSSLIFIQLFGSVQEKRPIVEKR